MKRSLKILIAVGIVLGVVILIPVIHHYQLRAATEAYIAQLKAQGEPMELAQVIPPPVPPEQNGASIFLKAASLLDTNWNVLGSNPPPGMLIVAPGKVMIDWSQPDVRSECGTNSWQEIEAALAKNDEALKLLYQISNYAALDFHLNYSNGVDNILLPHLASSREFAQRLRTKAIDDLHRGDTASAVDCASTMLTLVREMYHDRLIVSELVRIAIAQITLSVNWEILQSTNLTDDQLAELQHNWMNLDFVRAEENALEMERVAGQITAKKWRSPHSEFQHDLENYSYIWTESGLSNRGVTFLGKIGIRAKMFMWRYWWSYPDELQLIKGYQISLESTRLAETNYSLLTTLREQENKVRKLDIDTNNVDSFYFSDVNRMDLHSLMSASVLSLSQFLDIVMRAETTKQMAIAAIALKRYQLKHGNYPPNLDSLVPEFVPIVPLDPVDGQPLRYRQNADGTFLLYSVGENGKDDGGNPALKEGTEPSNYYYWLNPKALDWVWPQPATDAEIQNYYAHPPK